MCRNESILAYQQTGAASVNKLSCKREVAALEDITQRVSLRDFLILGLYIR